MALKQVAVDQCGERELVSMPCEVHVVGVPSSLGMVDGMLKPFTQQGMGQALGIKTTQKSPIFTATRSS
jgi:hypothetical protein